MITNDTLISAIAMAVGMGIHANDKVFEWCGDNGMGAIELYSELGELAELSHDLMTRVASCPDFITEDFPGVYAYEVDEEFGHWLGEALRNGDIPAGPQAPYGLQVPTIRCQLGRLALAFFDRAERAIPATEEIIAELTGYSRNGIIAVQVVPIIDDGESVTAQVDGPDERTTGWGVYRRMADGTAQHFKDYAAENLAMAMGRSLAALYLVEVEPQAWVKP